MIAQARIHGPCDAEDSPHTLPGVKGYGRCINVSAANTAAQLKSAKIERNI